MRKYLGMTFAFSGRGGCLEAFVEGFPINASFLDSTTDVSLVLAQEFGQVQEIEFTTDQIPGFLVYQSGGEANDHPAGCRFGSSRFGDLFRQMLGQDEFACFTANQGPHEHVLQLADIHGKLG